MPQLTEAEAERLSAEQATKMVRVLELQASWENRRDDPKRVIGTLDDLHTLQKTFDAFQTAWRLYSSAYFNARLPESTQTVPDRLLLLCRALRGVFQRAEGECPVQVMAKMYRLADQIAARMGTEPVGRGRLEDLAGAVRELDGMIAWCKPLVPPSGRPVKVKQEESTSA